VASVVLAFVLATILARTLGPVAYGTWAFFFTFLGYSSLFDLGLSTSVSRSVARAHQDGQLAVARQVVVTALFLATFLAAAVLGLVWVVPDAALGAFGDPAVVERSLRVMPLCILFSNVSLVTGGALEGVQRSTWLNLVRTTMGTIATVVLALLVAAGVREVDVLLLAFAATLLVTALWCWRLVGRELGRGARWRFDRSLARELLAFGGAIQVSSLALQTGDQALRVLLGARFGAETIGAYDLASRAALALRSLANAMLTVLVPFGAAQSVAGGQQALARLHELALKYLALLMIAGTAAGVLVVRPFVGVWLGGTGLTDMVTVLLLVLLVAHFLQALSGPSMSLGRSLGQVGPEVVTYVAGNALGVALAAFAGTASAAVLAFAAANTAASLALWRWLASRLRIPMLPAPLFARLAGAGALTTAAGWLALSGVRALEWPPVPEVLTVAAAAATAMGISALALRLVSAEERRLLSTALLREPRPAP
jgi:O-antigen/teichoic acid export membrane protein